MFTRLEVLGIKGIGATVVGFFIYMGGIVNEAVVVLVFFMILDMISGLLRSWVTKTLDSTIGFAGVIKKFAVILMVGAAAALEYMLISVGQEPKGFIILGVVSFFIMNEGISVLENCAQLGLPIPPILFNALAKLHKDPAGKEHRLARHPVMDRMDKAELLKQNVVLQQELKKALQAQEGKEEEDLVDAAKQQEGSVHETGSSDHRTG